MLQRSIDRHPPGHQAYAPARISAPRVQSDFDGDAVAGVLRNLRRNARLIMLSAITGTLIATAAVFSMTPLYKATTLVLVDPRQTKILQDAEVVGRPGTESGAIDSEAEMVTSPAVLRAVAEKMQLQKDDEFAGISGILGAIRAYVIAPIKRLLGAKSSDDPYGAIVDKLDKYSDAKRRALSYVIELNAWSRDAGKAMALANTIADQYLAQQVASKAKVTERATEWLNGRVEELRKRVDKSDRALEQYKAQAGLFDPAGENLSDRQIASLNDQLVDARAKAAAARAKYDQLKRITPRELRLAAATPDVLQSQVISNLRGQYADAARKLAEKAARYGPENPIVTSARAEASRLEAEISAEINRIVSSSKAEYEIAKSREESLEASLDDLKEKGSKFNEAMVKMHELEREAQANRDLFNSFLARAKQTAELNFQVPDSRVVSEATMPNSTSYPRRALIIGVAFFGSLGLGIAIALARGVFTRGFRNTSDIETSLGLQSLASIPLIEGSVRPAHGREPLLGNMRGARLSLPGPGTNTRASSRDRLAAARKLASLVVDQPDSPFSESVRALRFNIRHSLNDAEENTVLVTSALAGEGKSTIAANLAREAALAGERVLLLDADLRHPTLANSLEFQPRETAPTELADILLGHGDFRRSIRRDRKSGLYVVAGTARVSGAEAVALLSSPRMQELVEISRKAFDLVVIDAPPLLPIADSRVLVDLVDGVVMVVESEQTSREAVTAAIRETPALEGKLIGTVLNRSVDDFDRYYYGANPERKYEFT
jgi:exopolysaccharide transport family protein